MATAPVFVGSVKDAAIVLQNADGTNFKTLITASGDGQRVKSIMITSDDTSDRTLQICKTISAVDYILGEIVVPAGAGTDGSTPAVNGLDAAMMPGLQSDGVSRFLDLANGATLKVKSKAAVTAAKTINVAAEYGDF